MTTRSPNATIFAARILEPALNLDLDLELQAGLLVAVWVGNSICIEVFKDVDGVTVGS